jgi:HEPN domain-containing protein
MAATEPKEPEAATAAPGPPRSSDEVALELMKFIAVSTGYVRSSQPAAGFSGKPATRSPEEDAEALLELFERCRRVVRKES